MTDMSEQHAAAAQARLLRASYLVDVAEGRKTPLSVIDDAHEEWVTELRTIRLSTLFTSEQGMTERRWRLIRDRMLGALEIEARDSDMTIQWLLDQRAGGRRIYALRDALRSQTESSWPGFPWTTRPTGG